MKIRLSPENPTAGLDRFPCTELRTWMICCASLHAASHNVTTPFDIPTSAAGGVLRVIVVGCDGSPTSWDAFSWALGEAVRTHAGIVTVYVTPAAEPGAVASCVALFPQRSRDEFAGYLQTEVQRRARDLGVPVRFVRERGKTVQALTDVAHCAHADLIVVGRSAKKVHYFAGSVGHKLSSRRDAPAIVVVP
jgi:nucleotide-binding universal stress UspA family protein